MKSENSKILYFRYARKSTDREDRQVLSIPSQIDEMDKLVSDNKLDVYQTVDESKTAKKPGRPVFNKVLDDIEAGKAQGIIVWHANRLSRNSVDTGRLIYLMDLGKLLEVRTPNQIFRNTPNDKFLLNLFCSQAKLENDSKGEDVKRGLERKVKMGWLPGVAPEGYLNTPDKEKGCKIVVVDKKRFPLLRKALDLILYENHRPLEALKKLNNEWGYLTVKREKEGGKPMSRSGFYSFLKNPFYYQWFEYPKGSGQWRKGEHKPMMNEEEFERLQVLLGRKGRPAPHSREFAYTGLMTCGECGCQITAEEKNQLICSECKWKFAYENKDKCPKCETLISKMRKPVILKYIYYRCTKKRGECLQPYIGVKILETQINEFLAGIEINQKYLDWALKHLQKAHDIESSTRIALQKSQQAAFNNISKKLDRILEMRMNNEIDEKEYLAKKSTLLKEKQRFAELMTDTDYRQNQWLEMSERTFNFARLARQKFETGTLKQKKDILTSLGSNLVIKDRKLNIQALEPILILKNGLAEIPQARATLEPAISRSNKGQRELVSSLNPRWLRG